jgi:fungal STAND N-terminal Goodbye domain
MSQPSSSSTFHILFDAALKDYKDKTGTSLVEHPIAKQLETCESVDSITAILQDQARKFREFRENDGKLMKALNSSVDVLCAPSISSALDEAIGLVVS